MITNRHTHVSGIYYLPKLYIRHELNISRRMLDTLLHTLSIGDLAEYDPEAEVIWVKRMFRYQGKGEKHQISAAKHVQEDLHKSKLIKSYLEFYPEVKKRVSKGFLHTLSDTPSHGVSAVAPPEQEQEQDITTPLVPPSGGPIDRVSRKPRSKVADIRQHQAEEVLKHCNRLKHIPPVLDSDTKIYAECIRVISERIKDGSTVEQLKAHADRYDGKVFAYHWHIKRFGEKPDLNSSHWCPNIRWPPNELFGPKRFAKYFPAWRKEPVITKELLFEELERDYS